jgi:hypothetical protein
MPETALMVPSNLSHNVPALLDSSENPLTDLAKLYRYALRCRGSH